MNIYTDAFIIHVYQCICSPLQPMVGGGGQGALPAQFVKWPLIWVFTLPPTPGPHGGGGGGPRRYGRRAPPPPLRTPLEQH